MVNFSIDGDGLRPITKTKLRLQEKTEYYMGASDSPTHIIITNLNKNFITYRQSPYIKDNRVERWIGEDLINTGTRKWLSSGYAQHHPTVATNLKRLLNGQHGSTVRLNDYKRIVVMVRPNSKHFNPKLDYWRRAESYGGIGGNENLKSPTKLDYQIHTNYKGLTKIKKDKVFIVVSSKPDTRW